MARITNRLHTELTVDNKAADEYQRTFGSLQKLLGLMAGAYGLQQLGSAFAGQARAAFDANVQFEKYGVTLEVLYGSAARAQRQMAWIVEFAKKTPFELPELVEGTAQLKAFGLEAEDWMEKIGNLSAAMNAPVNQAVDALGKLASGLNGIAIRQFQYLGISRQMWMEQGIQFNNQGMALNETGEMLEALATIIEARYGGLMEKQSQTVGGMITNLKDFLTIVRMELGATVFEQIKGDLQGIMATIETLQESGRLQEWVDDVAWSFGELWRALGPTSWLMEKLLSTYTMLKALAPTSPTPGLGLGQFINLLRAREAIGEGDADAAKDLVAQLLRSVGYEGGALGAGYTYTGGPADAHVKAWQEAMEREQAARGIRGRRAGQYYQRGWERQPGGYLGLGTYRTYDVPDLMGGGGVTTPGIPEPSGPGARKPVDISGAISELEVYSEAWTHFWGENHDYIKRYGQMFTSNILDTLSLGIGQTVKWGEAWEGVEQILLRMTQKLAAAGFFSLLGYASPLFGGSMTGFGAAFKWISGFQHGTPYVPETGLYMLHRGEQVVPAHVNNSQQKNKAEFHFHGPIIGNRQWVRNELLPEIRNAVGKGWKAA